MSETTMLRGVVHGKTIELEHEPGLPDGQVVSVTMHPVPEKAKLLPGEGVRRSAGSWSDDPAGVATWLDEMQRSRQLPRCSASPVKHTIALSTRSHGETLP